MGEITKIEWCDHTFNPWIGCTKVSPACDHCYAESLAKRYGWAKWGAGEPRKRTAPANWHKPLKWDREAAEAGRRARVFGPSLADPFDSEVSDQWRIDYMDLIRATPNLDWLLLTKRPQVAWKFFHYHGPVPDNVWLGATVENQDMAIVRIPPLIDIKAKVHFLSCEPLVGPLTLKPEWMHGLDWIICGGETGHGSRMMPEDRARDLRDQCKIAGVYFFMKQMTNKAPIPADLLVREFPT